MSNDSNSKPVAVVTGGARGIGLAIGKWFLAHDYSVVLIDRDAATLDRAVAAIDRPRDLLAIHCDVSIESQVNDAAQQVLARFGRVDALVNNAGVANFKPVLETSFAEWREIMATNLDGVFLCSHAFGTVMATQRSGAIVNIGSISGLRASTLRLAYGTSKAALIHFTKQLAVELGDRGIRVNAVCPGPVDTEMAKLVHTAAIRADYHDAIPLGRYGTEEEIADAVGYLCSPQAGFINGQSLAVDGGFNAAGVGLPTLRGRVPQSGN